MRANLVALTPWRGGHMGCGEPVLALGCRDNRVSCMSIGRTGQAMSSWKRLPPNGGIHSVINSEFGAQDRPDRIVYPDLNDGSDIVLGTDYSGEHEAPEFHVLGFLVTTVKSIEAVWEPARLEVRKKYLHNDRRMSFKKLDDALRVNAFPTFLKAASQLNG